MPDSGGSLPPMSRLERERRRRMVATVIVFAMVLAVGATLLSILLS
jgi:hypothetical protein